MISANAAIVLAWFHHVVNAPCTSTKWLAVVLADGSLHADLFKKHGQAIAQSVGLFDGRTIIRADEQIITFHYSSDKIPEIGAFTLAIGGWGLSAIADGSTLQHWIDRCADRLYFG